MAESRPGAPPHALGPVVVDHQGQIPVVLPDLVCPDAEQAVEAAWVELAGGNPLTGPAHCPPRHAAQPGPPTSCPSWSPTRPADHRSRG